ncbi:AAA family ATPase [Streptomyces montanisoli]|uniref:AAA family ATPase n=1 Tax=Streptomyces montanisoli TaxID=2798581 RepID=A0A940MF42_9ACTN|nr:AAA family ATPase [Streptomyces montanisoli]MBP0458855.1 AAA family ATPase [Streptomyces montanisoli]
MAPTGSRPPTSLGEHLDAARSRAFVGRAGELALFRSVLTGCAHQFNVMFLTGPGGIGKSALLRRYAAEARTAGRTVVGIDARTGGSTPASFEAGAAPVFTERGAVLLVDAVESRGYLEDWLREEFLPRLPPGVLVVIAGRRPPGDAWRGDPGWDEVLRVVAVDGLPRADAVALLDARGVARDRQAGIVSFAGGNPLALSLAAETAGSDAADSDGAARPGAWVPAQDVIATLVSRVVGEVPSPEHRQALEVCAHVQVTTEELLRATLPGADASALFAWLRGLPFIEAGPHGLVPHDVVRGILGADLRWRDPQRHEAMGRRILGHLTERLRQPPVSGPAGAASVRALAAAVLHLRHDAFDGRLSATRPHEAYEDVTRPEDHAAVLGLLADRGGAQDVAAARHWLDVQPGAFTVYRSSATGELTGFMAWLRLSEPRSADTAADPVVARAWAHAGRAAPLLAGEHLAIARFGARRVEDPSAEGRLMSARTVAEFLGGRGLAWTYFVAGDGGAFPRSAPFAGPAALPPVRVGDRLHGLFAADRRALSTDEVLSRVRQAAPAHDQRPGDGPPATDGRWPSDPARPMARADFDAAVRDALRAWHRPDALAANPLARGGPHATGDRAGRAESLRGSLARAVEQLRGDRQGDKLHRAVSAAFFEGPVTQEAAAERLGIPFSTYRRHLARGLARVCELLWHGNARPGD